MEAFYEHNRQEVASAVTAGWKKTEEGVGRGSVMNGAFNFYPEFSKVSPITTTEGTLG